MMSYSYVCDSSKMLKDYVTDKDAGSNVSAKMHEHVQNIAEVFNVNIPVNQSDNQDTCGEDDNKEDDASNANNTLQLKSRREEQPLDEFRKFNELLTGPFPQVFPLGVGSLRNKRLNKDEIEHLLLQHTNAAGKNRELLFYFFLIVMPNTQSSTTWPKK